MRHLSRKRGFTLVETVVSVGIVAALAAVVYPVVARQYDSADPTRIQQDLSNIAIGIDMFNVNNRALPGDLDDLANQISTTAGAKDSSLTVATAGLPEFTVINLWQGPYLTASILDDIDTDRLLPTGFGANIVDSFVCYDAADDERGVSEATSTTTTVDNQACPTTPTQPFVAVQIIGISCSTSAGSTFMRINELFDGASETNADTRGRIRCVLGTATPSKDTDVDVVYFLAVPIS
jgi:prepilin-type N-terminal cleavage/methylation domain-containing protein